MEMQGYQQVKDLPKPYHLTTKDRLVAELGGLPRCAWKVLFVRKDCAILAQVNAPLNKIIKVTWPHVTVDASMTDVELYRPDGAHIPTERVVSDTPADKPKRGRAADGESKIAKCKVFYARQKDVLTREQIQKAFVDQFACTEQGANTYFLTCQRDWKPEAAAA